MNQTEAGRIAQTFGALADPTRVAIVGRLAVGDASVRELTEPFDLTQQAVSRHLRVLEDAGIVSRRRQAQSRPASLEIDRLIEIVGWVDLQRREWVARHERLAQHLARLEIDPSGRSAPGTDAL